MMPDQETDDAIAQPYGHHLVKPAHPGLFLRIEIIEGRHLSIGEAAEALGVLRPTESAVLNGRASLSPEMALRCEKAFSLSMDMLMRLQCAYDAGQANLL